MENLTIWLKEEMRLAGVPSSKFFEVSDKLPYGIETSSVQSQLCAINVELRLILSRYPVKTREVRLMLGDGLDVKSWKSIIQDKVLPFINYCEGVVNGEYEA